MVVDILSFVPLSVGGVIALLLNSVIAFIALVIADKVIAHNVDVKHLFIMSIVALFVTPIIGGLVLGYLAIPTVVSSYLLPLVVWIALGEVLIKEADMKTKLKVVIVGFIAYIVLSIFLAPYVFSLIPL